MKALLEVVILPVSDPDLSLHFYRDLVGFDLDVDYAPTPDFRVVQLTPQGSSTSIQFGVGLQDTPAGCVRGLYLVVPDIDIARRELVDRGVSVSDIRQGHQRGLARRLSCGARPRPRRLRKFRGFPRPRRQWLGAAGAGASVIRQKKGQPRCGAGSWKTYDTRGLRR